MYGVTSVTSCLSHEILLIPFRDSMERHIFVCISHVKEDKNFELKKKSFCI